LRLVKRSELGDGPSLSVQHLLEQMKKINSAAEPAAAPASPAPKAPVKRLPNGRKNLDGGASWFSAQRVARGGAVIAAPSSPAPAAPAPNAPPPRPVASQANQSAPLA